MIMQRFPRTFRNLFVGLVISFICTAFLRADVTRMKGVAQRTMFSKPSIVFRETPIDFELYADETRYAIKSYFASPQVWHKLYLVSDYKDVYASDTAGRSDIGAAQIMGTHAWATMQSGLLPRGNFQWMVPEILTLAYLGSRNVDYISDGKRLRPGISLSGLERLAQQGNYRLGSRVFKDSSGLVERIQFYSIPNLDPQVTDEAIGEERLLAVLEIQAREKEIPTRIKFSVYVLKGAFEKPTGRWLIDEYIFSAQLVEKVDGADVFRQVAYDKNVSAMVSDARFFEPTKGYKLLSIDEPPFQSAASYQTIRGKILKAASTDELRPLKRVIVLLLSGLTLVPLFYFMSTWHKRKN